MSTNTQTSTTGEGIIERYRERWFFAALIIGMATFALGFAFTILVLAMNTSPPAPYFATMTDRLLTGVVSLIFMVGGIMIIRMGAKIGGW